MKTNMLMMVSFAIVSALTVYFFAFSASDNGALSSLTKSGDAPVPYDLVTVSIHDKYGNLKYQETTHNIVTASGAIWFCVEQNGCSKQINGTTPAVTNVAAPTWWIQFITGSANLLEPSGADCTVGTGGVIAGEVSGGRCITSFGALSPAQYVSAGSVITLGIGTGQLSASSGTIDTTNNYVEATQSSVCTVTNGSSLASGSCQFTETSPVFTNPGPGTMTINGLALASGTASTATAGPLIIAESPLTIPIIMLPGDTASVTWTITV
ncbi:MAG: hypothetical protein ACREBI_03050 [Nitrosotalea sp.]